LEMDNQGLKFNSLKLLFSTRYISDLFDDTRKGDPNHALD